MESRYRNWLITINNPSEEDVRNLSEYIQQAEKWCYQFEKGEEAETAEEHLHCFVHFGHPVRVETIKRRLPRAHIDAIKNNPKDVIKYVTKQRTRTRGPFANFNYDSPDETPKQGNRNDLIKIRNEIQSGRTLKSIADSDDSIQQFARNFNFWRWYEFQHKVEQSATIRDVQVNYWWGNPGAGKTFSAISILRNAGESPYIAQKDNAFWWDGYTGQRTIILDDWDDTWTTLTRAKRLLDKYPLNLEVKGGYCPAAYTCIIITSNTNPNELYSRCKQDDRQALMRRIHETLHVTKKYEEDPSQFEGIKFENGKLSYNLKSNISCESGKLLLIHESTAGTRHEVAYNTKGNSVTSAPLLLDEPEIKGFIEEENGMINLDVNI